MAKKKKSPPKRKVTNKKKPTRRPAKSKRTGSSLKSPSKAPTSAGVGKKGGKLGKEAKQAKKATRGNNVPTKPKRTSLLDAAVRVLKESRKTMRSGDIVEVILKKGYWKTTGKTPAATLHAAMIREIKDKGQKTRFKKVDRGLFGLNPKS